MALFCVAAVFPWPLIVTALRSCRASRRQPVAVVLYGVAFQLVSVAALRRHVSASHGLTSCRQHVSPWRLYAVAVSRRFQPPVMVLCGTVSAWPFQSMVTGVSQVPAGMVLCGTMQGERRRGPSFLQTAFYKGFTIPNKNVNTSTLFHGIMVLGMTM